MACTIPYPKKKCVGTPKWDRHSCLSPPAAIGGQTTRQAFARATYVCILLFIALALPLFVTRAAEPAAQAQAATGPLTLERAVELAATNHPAIRAAQARVSASAAGIGLARTAYLPRTDLLWQVNR